MPGNSAVSFHDVISLLRTEDVNVEVTTIERNRARCSREVRVLPRKVITMVCPWHADRGLPGTVGDALVDAQIEGCVTLQLDVGLAGRGEDSLCAGGVGFGIDTFVANVGWTRRRVGVVLTLVGG